MKPNLISKFFLYPLSTKQWIASCCLTSLKTKPNPSNSLMGGCAS